MAEAEIDKRIREVMPSIIRRSRQFTDAEAKRLKDWQKIYGRVKNVRGKIKNTIKRADALQTKVNSLSGDVSNITKRVSKAESNVKNLTKSVSNIEGRVSNAESTVTTLESNVNDLSGDVSNMTSRVSKAEKAIDNVVSSELPSIRGSLSSLKKRADSLDSGLDDAVGRLDTIRNETIPNLESGLRSYADKKKEDIRTWAEETAIPQAQTAIRDWVKNEQLPAIRKELRGMAKGEILPVVKQLRTLKKRFYGRMESAKKSWNTHMGTIGDKVEELKSIGEEVTTLAEDAKTAVEELKGKVGHVSGAKDLGDYGYGTWEGGIDAETKGFVGYNFRMFAYMHAFKASLEHLINTKKVIGVEIHYPVPGRVRDAYENFKEVVKEGWRGTRYADDAFKKLKEFGNKAHEMFSKTTQFAEAQREMAEELGKGVKDLMNTLSDLFDIDLSFEGYGLEPIHLEHTEAENPATKNRQVPTAPKVGLPETPSAQGAGKLSSKELKKEMTESLSLGISRQGRIGGVSHTVQGTTRTTRTAAKKQTTLTEGEEASTSELEGEIPLKPAFDARDAARSARDAAKTHKNDTKTYRNQSRSARNTAKTHRNDAKTYRNQSRSAKNDSKTFRNQGRSARNTAKTHRNDAKTYRNQSRSAKNTAQTAKNTAKTYRTQSRNARDSAQTAKSDAEAAATRVSGGGGGGGEVRR